jgi:hypothetical protein
MKSSNRTETDSASIITTTAPCNDNWTVEEVETVRKTIRN